MVSGPYTVLLNTISFHDELMLFYMAGETGKEAFKTLHAIRLADKFNAWMFDTIRPFIKGKVLEAGSGIGNISAFLLKQGNEVWLSDLDENYCRFLRDKFASSGNLKDVLKLNLGAAQPEEAFPSLFNSFDTIVATNVVEHIQFDQQAIDNCRKLLKKDGHLVVLVPAGKWLFNSLDREFGHYRRYSKKDLITLMGKDMALVHTQYFNFAGIAAWFFTGSFLRKRTIPPLEMSLFNKMVPLFKLIDRGLLNKSGLSIIAVAKKIV